MEESKQSRNEKIEAFLREKYQFRFNSIKSRTEYRLPNEKRFKVVNKYAINSIRRELDKRTGITTPIDNLRTILESDFAERVNPVHEYFRSLPRVDINSTDPSEISRLASTVTVSDPTHWCEYLVKWLVGVVANAMTDVGCQNHVCLVLTGDQGKRKTSWLDGLCPKELKGYLFTGTLDPQSKDVLTLVAECLLINIDDQLKKLNKRDANDLKNLITTPVVKYRRPYDVYIEEYPHLASFMASINGNDFLTDPTGSRRFLPFEALSIDIEAAAKIDIDKVYSEAVSIWESGFRYWFNDEEIAELNSQSAGFHVQSVEYEMLVKAFEKPAGQSDNFMTTSEVLNYLRINTSLTLSEKRMGEALRKAGFERKSKRMGGNPVYGWVIAKVTPNPFIII